MKKVNLSEKVIMKFKRILIEEEKSKATVDKYMRDITTFYEYLPNEKLVTKELVILYKEYLSKKYKPTSSNSMLVALNRFFDFIGIPECKVKLNKIQRRIFGDETKEMTKEEYKRLLMAAKSKHNERLYVLLQTICSTGIRVSEHQYITVEALKCSKVSVNNKKKIREIYISKELKKLLIDYCKKHDIKSGPIFITKNGKPLDRSNIWSDMKALCKEANIDSQKVYPHNLRHLFAITFYQLTKDLDTLASLLGHSSIDTTRIYTRKSGKNCTRIYSKMQLCLRI
ncbi:MAG: tyrosine-type recombinase/integrase [Longibaculum sp.]